MREYLRHFTRYIWFAFGVTLFGMSFWALMKAGMAKWAPEGFKEAVAVAA